MNNACCIITNKDRGGSLDFCGGFSAWDPADWSVTYNGEEYEMYGFDLNMDNRDDISLSYGALINKETGKVIDKVGSSNKLISAGETVTLRFFGIIKVDPKSLNDGFELNVKVPNSKGEKEKWAKTLDQFFKHKEEIAHVFMLVDSRHDPTADDVQMIEFLHYHTIPFTVTLTKADKLSKMKLKEHIKAIAADLYLGEKNLLATSAETGYGKNDVLSKIRSVIDVANLPMEPEEEDEETDDEEV